MTIVYSFDFFETRTEQMFNGRLAAKVAVCLVKNVHDNKNQPIRRYQIADITGLNAHNISVTLDQMVKLGIVVKHAIDDNIHKAGYSLDLQSDAAKALVTFITNFESARPKVVAMMGH